MSTDGTKSLYERLGGANGITAIIDDILENHMNNPAVRARFLPLKDDPKHYEVTREHIINFFSAGCGGPEQYAGKGMTPAHKGMNISQGEYMEVVDDIMNALIKHKIDDQTQKDVLAIAYALKPEIIGQ